MRRSNLLVKKNKKALPALKHSTMKTEQLKEFETSISDLNNCFSHYIFVWEQFSIDNKDIIGKASDKTTVDIFKLNSNSRQFNVALNYLENSHDYTQDLILKSIFQLAYGYFESYLIRLHQFGQLLDSSVLDLQQKIDNEDIEDFKVFDKFLNRFNISIDLDFEPSEIMTLDYIRLRRNRITHRAKGTQGVLLDLINNHGKKLNVYWDKRLSSKRYSIDFSRKKIDNFEKLELFDILNILRRFATKIDQLFLQSIDSETLHLYIYNKFLNSVGKKVNGLVENRKKSKFKSFCKSEFGYEISEDELCKIKF